MRLKLRTKLILTYLLPVLALVLLAGVLAYRTAHRALEDALGNQLVRIAQTVAGHINSSDYEPGRIWRLHENDNPNVRARLNEWLTGLRDSTEMRRIFIFRPDLARLLDTDEPEGFHEPLFELEPDRTELDVLIDGELLGVSSVLFTDSLGTPYMNGYAPILLDTDADGSQEVVGIVAVEGSALFFRTLDQYRAALVILGVLVSLIVVVLSFSVAHRLTRPLGTLVDALRRYGRGELKEPVTVESRDEIGFVTEAFNSMRERLDKRDEQMQLMLHGIAHEVRNPLAGMELFCSLLRDDLEGQPLLVEHVDKIERELDYLSRVVSDFLNYARRRPLAPEKFEVNDLVDSVVGGLKAKSTERNVAISVEVPDGLEATGEREALRGILTNLVQNAIQACSGGGEVVVRAQAEGPNRVLSVIDNGKGIETAQLDQIFDPFFTTREKGTGLGLALARKTVQEHRGEIEVLSEVNKGTTFTITLPFDDVSKQLIHVPEFEGPQSDVEMIG